MKLITTKKTIHLAIVIIIIFLFSSCFNCQDFIEEEIRPIYIRGVVKRLNKTDNPCFLEAIILQKEDSTMLYLCTCGANDFDKEDLAIGDSLYKDKSTSILTVISKNKPRKEFNYPCCDH